MEAMTAAEQDWNVKVCAAVRAALSTLRHTHSPDDDIQVAAARLENWLEENEGRWVK